MGEPRVCRGSMVLRLSLNCHSLVVSKAQVYKGDTAVERKRERERVATCLASHLHANAHADVCTDSQSRRYEVFGKLACRIAPRHASLSTWRLLSSTSTVFIITLIDGGLRLKFGVSRSQNLQME